MALDSTALARASIRELGALLRGGEVSPLDLADDALRRLDTDGRRLNAVVTLTVDRALRAARRAEAELRSGVDRGPLHGIPYGAKDLCAAAGHPTTWGAAPFVGQRFPEDATVIERLESAGAVLVAKLAMVELAGGMGYDHANASLTGPGLSPWNPSAWSGGSSSGSGSAVGARCVPFAIGSETHGSITTPSAFCGVSGLRPTYGRVSRHGAMALSWTMDKLGPMARSADDCGLVLVAIAGPDPEDPTCVNRPWSYRPERARTSGFRLGLPQGALDGAEPEVAANFEASLAALREFCTIEECALPDLPYAAVARIIIAAEASSAFEDFIGEGGPAGLTCETDRFNPYAYDAILARDYLRALRLRRLIAREMDALCARFDALVTPTLVSVAPPADQSFNSGPWRRATLQLGAAANVAGIPAVSVPNGLGSRGLPTALCLTGRAFEEHTLLAIAAEYQRRTRWHEQLPPGISG